MIKKYIPEGDITLYSKWVDSCTVTFDGNGGLIYGNADMPQYQIKIEAGKQISDNPYAEIADEHLVFAGWYLEPECINSVENVYEYVPEGNITFYAKWVDCYLVTFDGNGGFIFGNTDMPQYQVKVQIGTPISRTPHAEISDTTKRFDGWYLEPECINYVENPSECIPEGDITFYAKWVDIVTQSSLETDAIVIESDVPEMDVKETVEPENDSEQVTEAIELETIVSEKTVSEPESAFEPEPSSELELVVESVGEVSQVLEATSEEVAE